MNYSNSPLSDRFFQEEANSILDKRLIVDEVYSLLEVSYASVKGGLHFGSRDALILSTDIWKLIYLEETLVGVVIYKAKRGLKMVAMAISHTFERRVRRYTKRLLAYMFRVTFTKSWMEVSEAAERFILQNGGERYLIPNTQASKITGKEILSLCDDGYHYTREINGVIKTKVMVGSAKV